MLKRCDISLDSCQLGVFVQKRGVLNLVKCKIGPPAAVAAGGPAVAASSSVGSLCEAGGTLMLRDTHVLGVGYACICKSGTTAEVKGCIFENVGVAIALEEGNMHLQVYIHLSLFLESSC